MIFGLDKSFTIIATLDDNLLSAVATVEINKQSLLDFSVPIEEALSENIKYFAIPYPNRDTGVMVFEYSSKEDDGDTTTYSAAELAYNELATDNYITDRRPETQSASALLKLALEGSNWTISTANVGTKVHTNFYYVSNLEAINSVVTAGGGEIIFYMDVVGNKITGRHIDYLLQQGDDNGAWFEWDDEVLSIDRKEEHTQMYSRILPRGKGELLEGEKEADTPDGYGRRITIKDVVWKKPANPLDKAKGAIILENPDATKLYPNLSGKGKLLIKIYEDIDQPEQLIQQAYTDLMASSRPLVQYSADVAEVGSLSLGDAVTISHPNPLLSFKTRVFKVEFDLVDPLNSKVSLGDNLADNDIISQLNDLSSQATANSDMTNWTHHNGDKGTSYGTSEPKNPKKGDVWFKSLPNGKTELYYYDGTGWVLSAKTDQQWQENRAVAQGNSTTFYGSAEPVGAVVGDVWFKNDNIEPDGKAMYTYSGTVWVKFKGAYDANRLTSGEINGAILRIKHVDTNELVGDIDGKLNKIKHVDTNELVGDIDGKLNKIKHVDTSALIGGLDGTKNPLSNVPAEQLTGTMNKEVVNAIKLNAEQITAGELNSNIVNAIELNAKQITAGELTANIVNAMRFNAKQITAGELNANIVNAIELNAKQITSGKLNSKIVNTITLNAKQITAGELNSNIVNAMRFNASQVVAGQIDASIINVFNLNADHIKTGTIDASKINVMNISADNIVTGTLSANFIKGGQIDASQINVININVNALVGNTADFGGVHIDPEKIVLTTTDPLNPKASSTLTLIGGSVTFSNTTSNIDKTRLNNYGLDIHRSGTKENAVWYRDGISGGAFWNEKSPYVAGQPGIVIGDGDDNNGYYMTWGISAMQNPQYNDGPIPLMIWAGAGVGKIYSVGGPVWEQYGGWILPDNMRFSTWDRTPSMFWFDDTTKFLLESHEITINQHLQGGGTSTMKIGNYVLNGNNAWVGWTSGDSQAGFGVDGTGDVWIMVKGQMHSMYALINKVGGV